MKHTLAIVLAGSVSAADFGADRHGAKGVACASCHGEKNEVAYPSIEQCSKCHNPADMEKKTKDMKPSNPQSARLRELPRPARRNRELLRPVPHLRLQGAVTVA